MFIIFYKKTQLNFLIFFVGAKLIKKIHQWNLSKPFVNKVLKLETF
jgi:hypothetical protein